MQVTDFHKTKAGRIALFVDGSFLLSMHPDVFAASGLSVGSPVDEDALRELAAEADLKKAKEKALSLLSYKEYTGRELQNRLSRQVDEQTAAQAVDRMRELGLVNDESYAVRYARELSQRKGFGLYRVRQELRHKGIDPETIEQTIEQLEPVDACETIRATLQKKYPAAWEDETVRRRAFAAMLRLGHSSQDVRRVLSMPEEF